jgi:hypothetical protein
MSSGCCLSRFSVVAARRDLTCSLIVADSYRRERRDIAT